MKYSNITLLADKLRLLSDYGRYDGIKYINKRPFRNKGINFKVIDSGEIRIKIRNNFFIHVNNSLEISSKDIIINKERYPSMIVWRSSSIDGAIKKIEAFLNKPKLLINLMLSRFDPTLVGKFKLSGNLLRDDNGKIAYIKLSDLQDIVTRGLNGEASSFSFDLSATINSDLTPKMKAR